MWPTLIRFTAFTVLLGLLGLAVAPAAGGLTAFVVTTLWVHGPVSPFLPAAYEPVLMHYGTLYPPYLVALIGAAANVVVEALNYRLYRDALEMPSLSRLRESRTGAWALRHFRRAPFLTVWVGSWSPIPDWMVRILGPMARYPLGKYLPAMALGRIPRYWLFAEVGHRIGVDGRLLVAALAASLTVGLAAAVWKGIGRHTRPRPVAPVVAGNPSLVR